MKELTKTQKQFLDAFEKSAGNVSQAAKKAGIHRCTFYQWCDSSDIFKRAVEDIREGLIDYAESMLYKSIRDGNVSSLIFFLKTKGRSRGYVESQQFELTGENGGPVEVKVDVRFEH